MNVRESERGSQREGGEEERRRREGGEGRGGGRGERRGEGRGERGGERGEGGERERERVTVVHTEFILLMRSSKSSSSWQKNPRAMDGSKFAMGILSGAEQW